MPLLSDQDSVQQRLAIRALDFGGPGLLDQSHDRGRQRYIVEFLGLLTALFIGPAEKLQGFGRGGGVLRRRMHQNESGTRDWPRLGAPVVRENLIKAWCTGPIG